MDIVSQDLHKWPCVGARARAFVCVPPLDRAPVRANRARPRVGAGARTRALACYRICAFSVMLLFALALAEIRSSAER